VILILFDIQVDIVPQFVDAILFYLFIETFYILFSFCIVFNRKRLVVIIGFFFFKVKKFLLLSIRQNFPFESFLSSRKLLGSSFNELYGLG